MPCPSHWPSPSATAESFPWESVCQMMSATRVAEASAIGDCVWTGPCIARATPPAPALAGLTFDGVDVALSDGVAELVPVSDGVNDGVSDGVGAGDCVPVGEAAAEMVPDGVPEPDAVTELVTVALPDGVSLGEPELVADCEVVAVALAVGLIDGVCSWRCSGGGRVSTATVGASSVDELLSCGSARTTRLGCSCGGCLGRRLTARRGWRGRRRAGDGHAGRGSFSSGRRCRGAHCGSDRRCHRA